MPLLTSQTFICILSGDSLANRQRINQCQDTVSEIVFFEGFQCELPKINEKHRLGNLDFRDGVFEHFQCELLREQSTNNVSET